MVFEETITIECFFGGLTIAINGFTMVFLCCYHRFQWFLMVPDHWSNDAMVSMDCCGLATIIKLGKQLARNLGKDEDEVVRHMRQRLGVLIVRDNAMMMASRHPTFAPPDVDGDDD